MRKAFKLPDDGSGVLISTVTPTGSCDGVLKSGDILLAIDGKEVDSAGMVTIDGEEVNMNEIVERKFSGDKVALRFLRDGKSNEVEITLKPLPQARMYAVQYEKKPRYIVFAGLVFQPLDTNLLRSMKLDDINVRRLFADYVPKGGFQKRDDIVVLTRIESDPLTSQMDEFTGFAVDKINGVEVKSLKHANELLNPEQKPEFFVIDLFGADRPVVIPASEIEAANKRIQLGYDIKRLSRLEE
ncbi:MAG: PDZ domain-containing protein [Luteolibacter sp.]